MLSRLSTAFVYAFLMFTVLAAAKPWGVPATDNNPPTVTVTVTATSTAPAATPPVNQCNTGSLQCCNSVQSADSGGLVGTLLGLLGIAVGSVTGLVGLTCSPLSVIGVGGNSCTAQPVCCENNSFNGLIALGCSPINLNL